MKSKYGYLAIAAGLATMLGGLALKEHCCKCGSTLFGFGLAHILLGSFSLMKNEGDMIPKKITIPIGDTELEMQ